MATREGKTPRKVGGGRFNTIATSTPSKGMPPTAVRPLALRNGGGDMAAAVPQSVQTPKRGGALFENKSPLVGQAVDEHKDASSGTIKVFVRVRPMSSSESTGRTENIVSVPTTDTVVLQSSEPKPFTFDYVADSTTTQTEVFDMIGRPFTDSCLKGYNGCIFAYGQTGSGKTFTMQGPEADVIDTESPARGLIPRTFEYLFERIAQKEAMANATTPGSLQFAVRCSYMEIYNETVTDLLDPSKTNLAVRENNKDGIYVDGITWSEVRNAAACVSLLHKGLRNRKVSETSMNKESSRSHSLLTLKVESTHLTPDGITKQRHSCLNLVDLAGSERQKSTNASGDRLKEASNINRSLSALGNVIMALADMSDGKARHVHYRDSKLTFLLKDSLGGNSKTAIISNISPADSNFGETLSTLKFAQRAKLIKTRAILNEDTNGSLEQLRAEIKRLKAEVSAAKAKQVPDGEVAMGRPSMSMSAGEAGDGMSSREKNAMQERISALENLLYQSMEAQTVAEQKYDELLRNEKGSLQRIEEQLAADNDLFNSLKMQLKLKTESVKHLASKKCASAAGAAAGESERVADLEHELQQLRCEIAELKKAQDAPMSNHPEFRLMMVENSKLVLATRASGAFVVESNVASGCVKLTPNPQTDERQHLEKMAREVRDQFMNAVRDKKALVEELAAVRASVSSSSSSRRLSGAPGPISVGSVMSPASQASLAAMTTPERKTFESVRLQMWRDEQAFEARRKRLEEELDTTKREMIALQTQLSSAVRRADFAEMELEELKPSIRRLSVGGDTGVSDAASEIERIAKRAAEARMSCESEKQGRAAAEAALHSNAKLEEELRTAEQALEEANKREATLRHQLEAAEYAVAASERRANKQQRASLAADPGRLAQLQEDNEQLQLKLANLQDEYESRKEEFAFLESKVQRITRELSQQEEHARAQAHTLEGAKASLVAEQLRIADLEAKLTEVASGDEAQAALLQSLQEAERKVAELEKKLDESSKNEAELRDGLAHQQEVHEALQKEAGIAQEVLRETLQNMESKTEALEQAQADLNDKSSEVRELSEKLDGALADLDHVNKGKEEVRRRHEALIDDREAVEREHQAQMDEMMAELKKRQERIGVLEKELEGTAQRASKAEKRLSNVEEAASETEKLRGECRALQAQIASKENEAFEVNFEIKGMQSKVKLLETERDELLASLGEIAHVRDELQAKTDKLQKQMQEMQEELEASQDEAGRLMADLSDTRARVEALECAGAAQEEEKVRLSASLLDATQRAETAEAAHKVAEQEKAAAGSDGSSRDAELAGLKKQMEAWLDDMRHLKSQEQAAVAEAASTGKRLGEAEAERDKAVAALAEAQKQVEELNAINSKLIGHSNAKQKVQHVVKMKEENNELHASLKKAQAELTKLRDKSSRLEKEVDKLRGALGVEGGADQVLAEEERNRSKLAAKEAEYKDLVRQLESMLSKALEIAPALGGAGEALAVCTTGEGDAAICERVERVLGVLAQRMADDAEQLAQNKNALKNRDFENELLKKQLQLRGASLRHGCGAPTDDAENQHPNSPSATRKTPGKGLGHAVSHASKTPGRRSVTLQQQQA